MKSKTRNVVVASLLLASMAFIGPSPATGQSKALSEADLKSLVTLGIDESAVVSKIKSDGIQFVVDQQVLADLKSAGASDAVLDALRKAARPLPAKTERVPITYADVLKLLKLHIDERTIISRLAKSPTIFTLDAPQVAELKAEGASQRLLDALAGNRPSSGQNNDITDFAIILDCSGSMTERTKDGVRKIDAAKRVVTDLVQKIPDGLRLAFIVYGSERKNTKAESCADIRLARALSELDSGGKADLAKAIRGFRAIGMTPIAESLKIAGRELLKNDAFGGIVLISDGKESCGGDPAAEAAELAKSSKLSFGVNVIGFDVRDDERRSLEEIAEKGKGKYYNAETAANLESAVASLQKELAAKVKVAPEQRASRQTVMAGKQGKPGTFLNTAGLVEPDEYKGSLSMMQADYYKIAVRKGQELRAIGKIKKSPYKAMNRVNNQTFSITIYDETLSVVAREAILVKDTPREPQTWRSSWTATGDGFAYVAIAASGNTDKRLNPIHLYPEDFKPHPSAYSLVLKLNPLPVEAPGTLEGIPAVNVAAGRGLAEAGTMALPGLTGTDLKLGETAFYKTKVKKGQVLHVSAAAQKPWYNAGNSRIEATYTLTVYDDDQVQAAQRKVVVSKNPADAQSATLEWPVTQDGFAFIAVSSENSGADVYPRSFDPAPGYVAVQVTDRASGSDKAVKDSAEATK